MSVHSPRLQQPQGAGPLVYPPAWYLNLVQLRLHTVEKLARSPAAGIHYPWNTDREIGDEDEAEQLPLFGMALELMRPLCIDRFSYEQQAYIVGIGVFEVREYLREVFNGTGLQASAATMIIEDEAPVVLDLSRIVRQTGHRVCGTATRLEQAVAVAARTQPVLVLADIQLRDGPAAGLAAVRQIRELGETAAVYVTAYPERVRDAVSAPLVVSKPFIAQEIQAAIWRALYRRAQESAAAYPATARPRRGLEVVSI